MKALLDRFDWNVLPPVLSKEILLLCEARQGNCTTETLRPFDKLRVNGILPIMVSLSNHVHSAPR